MKIEQHLRFSKTGRKPIPWLSAIHRPAGIGHPLPLLVVNRNHHPSTQHPHSDAVLGLIARALQYACPPSTPPSLNFSARLTEIFPFLTRCLPGGSPPVAAPGNQSFSCQAASRSVHWFSSATRSNTSPPAPHEKQ